MFDMIKNSERVSMECTSVPHICGETEINSVKDILKEWIQTEPELLDEDVAYVSNYFLNLVSHRDWLKLTDVFKCLYELVLTRDETLWTETYNSLVALVRSDLENTSDIPAELINKFNPIERIC
ncbi:hypothetical protein HDE_10191 [Halotydeus destructor]|nr:hypothetical protein HDE_10191 [Halotydeus destructor]